MVEALILACAIAMPDCNYWTAERHAVVEVPPAFCTVAAMREAARLDIIREGETLKIVCRPGRA